MAIAPLTITEIATCLEEWLEVEFTFYKVEAIAKSYANLDTDQQRLVLSWIQRIATTNIETAWRFANKILLVHDRLDMRLIEAWALNAVDAYDRSGLRAALKVIDDVDHFAILAHNKATGAVFSDISGILLTFVHGLAGRHLKIATGDACYTDSETLYLPAIIAEFDSIADNFFLAKSKIAMLWAQTKFGTFRCNFDHITQEFADPQHAIRCFNALESIRLESCIARELPGLYRDMQHLKHQLQQQRDPIWQQFIPTLTSPQAKVDDSLSLLPQAYTIHTIPCICYATELRLDAVRSNLNKRCAQEKILFRLKVRELFNEADKISGKTTPHELTTNDKSTPDIIAMELFLDGKPLAPPEDMQQLINSIILDFGMIPPEYLFPAGSGEYDAQPIGNYDKNPDAVWQGAYHEEGAFLYPEWDYRRQHYRKNWTVVREKTVPELADTFVASTIKQYAGLIKHLRRTFEAMRDGNKILKRQKHGDDIDIDALTEALADVKDGREMTEQLFTHNQRHERSIAVMFMVDMSGSTKGWINDAERQALVLLCEALEVLGDTYAIYGFSSMTRKRCEIFLIKSFTDSYSDTVKNRIAGIQPQEYTRMGFAIRHLTKLLLQVEAKRRILVTISDGKPDDYFDGYRGPYGLEDTKKALQESINSGIHPFCITIDREAKDYLPQLYGTANYVVLSEVKQLPLRVTDIYRRITGWR
ncbi:nitric oxide reductase activation protein [Achromatium sp. WMS2]|nr:nitric oxide reductase activation protein [Achromatium sp. WMS2]